MEELLPKDNENIPPIFLGPIAPSEPQGFKLDEMVTCEECLRANAPTRVACMYCGKPLPVTEVTARLRRPTLRAPEKNQLGFNSIIFPQKNDLPDESLTRVAKFLRLDVDALKQIIVAQSPLPVARLASREESQLVTERLAELGVQAMSVSDTELGFSEPVSKVRSLSFDNNGISLRYSRRDDVANILFPDIVLIVAARIVRSRIEISERKTRKSEDEIIDSSQFFSDELVIDLYSSKHPATWRISSGNFDFSCLAEYKSLVAGQNLNRLSELLLSRSSNSTFDNAYNKLRPVLEFVWTSEAETTSKGWRRERPGKYVVGATTSNSNEEQFTRYSRLRYFLTMNPLTEFA